MNTSNAMTKIDGSNLVETLHELTAQADNFGRELVLDFSNVHRLQPSALAALEQLADAAGAKSTAVVLRGVDVDVYRVLKLVKITPKLTFLN